MSVFSKITSIFKTQKKSTLTQDDIQDLYNILINSDLSTSVVNLLMKNLDQNKTVGEAIDQLKSRMISILEKKEKSLEIVDKKPFVIFVAGVNGSGKTTTIAKMANKFVLDGKKVLVGACDTFRVAAVEQLAYWCVAANANIEKPLKEGEDPASVCYRSFKKAQDENFDVLILDTSGRLQTNKSLMDELKKIYSVLQKLNSSKPDLTLCVIDGSAGQNAIVQYEEFGKYINLDGVCITKLDSSSKGGAIFSIADSSNCDIYFSCFGEKISDLSNFNAKEFVENIFKIKDDNN
jgi:fused signal recognition particle receptor